MELVTALRPLEFVEQELAEIYEALGVRFQDDEEASRVFARLSFEEKSHAGEIQFLRRLSRQNPAEYAEINLELPTLLTEIDALQEFHGRVADVSLEDALHFAVRAERGLAETHARSARSQAHPVVSNKLSELSEADRKHLGRIYTFATSRGILYDPPQEP
jgi:rubrerythrin